MAVIKFLQRVLRHPQRGDKKTFETSITIRKMKCFLNPCHPLGYMNNLRQRNLKDLKITSIATATSSAHRQGVNWRENPSASRICSLPEFHWKRRENLPSTCALHEGRRAVSSSKSDFPARGGLMRLNRIQIMSFADNSSLDILLEPAEFFNPFSHQFIIKS